MDEPNFDRFDDNTFAVTISLAEYRSLITGQAYAYQQIAELQKQVDELTARRDGLIDQVQLLQGQLAKDAPDE